jgi:antitoxin component YwqK of YwqJK toxin-antitoxin module
MGLFNFLFGKKETTSEPKIKTSESEATTKKKANKHESLEITNEEMCKLKDEDTYLDKKGNSFTGILFSQATTDDGRIQCEYKNGKRHGEYIKDVKDKPDQIQHTKYYKNGLKHGPDTRWYEKYKDGKNPKKKKYSDDSELPSEIAGMMDQMTKSHDVMRETNFKDGVFHGKIVDYNWNGGINFEINLKEGKKDGVWKQYFENPMGTGQGALKKISIYKDDKHISSKYYDFDNDDMSKEDALNDEEWGGEAWEQDTSFL